MARIVDQEFELTAIDRLREHPENYRQGDVEAIKRSFEELGFYGTVVAQRSTGYVCAGNHRVRAAKQLGMTEIPVMWVDVDDTRARAILAVDNGTADKAENDDAALLSLLRGLDDEGALAMSGYTHDDMGELERITGELGRDASSFLDGFAGDDTDGESGPGDLGLGAAGGADGAAGGGTAGGAEPGVSGAGGTVSGDDGDGDDYRPPVPGPVNDQFYSLNYMLKRRDRDAVLSVLNFVKDRDELETAAEALLVVVREYGSLVGVNGDPEDRADDEAAVGEVH